MRAIAIIRQLAHTDGFDAQVVAKTTLRDRLAKLTADEHRGFLADLRRSGKLAAPGVFVIANPLAVLVYQGLENLEIDPRPVDVAGALEAQHGWTIGMPRDVSLYMLGMGERPLSPSVLPYDQAERREFACGLILEPADQQMVRRTPVAQIVLQALSGKDLSAEGIERLAATAAAGAVIATPSMRQELAECLSHGELYGAAEAFAQALLSTESGGYATRAPADWVPPAEPDAEVRVDGWRVAEIEDRSGRYFALVASTIHGHPYISNGSNLSRSSPILWIDIEQGWCRTQSRLYRLGPTVEQRREEQRQQAEAERQRGVVAIQEIRAVANTLPVELIRSIDWDHLERVAGECVFASPELREVLVMVLERGALTEASAAVVEGILERAEAILTLDLDF